MAEPDHEMYAQVFQLLDEMSQSVTKVDFELRVSNDVGLECWSEDVKDSVNTIIRGITRCQSFLVEAVYQSFEVHGCLDGIDGHYDLRRQLETLRKKWKEADVEREGQ